MKNVRFLIIVIFLSLSLSACNQSVEESSPEPNSDLVEFTDEVLGEKVREAIGKPSGDISILEAEDVTMLDLSMEPGVSIPRIKNLSSLKYFTKLTSLNLAWALDDQDLVVDISVLADLEDLEALYLNSNGLDDISSLAGLTEMKDLKIWGNNISDISALSQMTMLEDLWMQGNQISDIGVLSNIGSNLVRLYLDDNQIKDISPLKELTKLRSLKLEGNPIVDYSPIKEIYPKLEEKDFDLN